MTIANPPYTGGDAAQWWRDLASVAVLIRQVFFTSPNVPQLHALGPVRASRSMRTGMRALVRRFTEIGIPASRVALELQFQSAPGTGGREGLQPRSKWLEIVKLEALAVRQVTEELKTHSIWSWGLGDVQRGGHRPRQERGGLRLPVGARPESLQRSRCRGTGLRSVAHRRPAEPAGGRPVRAARPGRSGRSPSTRFARAIGDRDIAASLVLERLVLQQEVSLDARAVLAAELAFVDDHFRGNLAAYLAALQKISLSRSARAWPPPRRVTSATPCARVSHPGGPEPARSRSSTRPTAACGHAWWRRRDRSRGSAAGPAGSRSRRSHRPGSSPWRGRGFVRTIHGRIEVRPLDDTVYLGTIPITEARPAIEASLNRFARVYAYEAWLAKAEAGALAQAICTGDESPTSAVLTLDDLLPFVTAPPPEERARLPHRRGEEAVHSRVRPRRAG